MTPDMKRKQRTFAFGLSTALVGVLFLIPPASLRAAKTNTVYFPPEKIDFIALLPPPPASNSLEQIADLDEVRTVYHRCHSNDSALARSEAKFTIFSFTPVIGEFFQPGEFPKTEAFFIRVHKTASAVTDVAKDFWRRPRPFTVDTNLAFGELEKSFSYPSGHSTRGTVFALLLAELFPDRRDAILAEGRAIGWHRVQIARHYPTDIFAGRVLAQAIINELKSDPDFQCDFAKTKAEIAAKNPAANSLVQIPQLH